MGLGYTSYYTPDSGAWGYGGSGYYSPYPSIAYTPNFSPGFYSPTFTPGQISVGSPYVTPPSTGNTEGVTVTAQPSPAVQSPTISPGFGSPALTNVNWTPPYVTPTFTATPTGNTEGVTVTGTAPPAVQSPTFSPGFGSPALTPGQVYVGSPYVTPVPTGNTEAVTVTAKPPVPQQVQTPAITWQPLGPFTPANFPLPYITPAGATVTPPQQQPAKKSSGGGGSGGSPASPKPPTQPQQQPQPQRPPIPQPRPQPQQPQRPVTINLPQPVTPQQKQQLTTLTPQQLTDLFRDPSLTPEQRAAVGNALTQKNQTAVNRARAGVTPGGLPGGAAAKAKAALAPASPASPLQPHAFVVPLLIAAGVATAWGVTHRQQVQTQVRATTRRIRRVFN